MSKIFVSHAVADRELVDSFVDFLVVACGVDSKNIFCTSLEGLGIREGEDFYKAIHTAMKDSTLVIMIITPAYFESTFCVCELGATWILQRNCFPIVVPPLTYSDLKAVLTPTQAALINSSENLGNLFDRIVEIKLGSNSTARFGQKRDLFLKKFVDIRISPRASVSAHEYAELKAKYDAALQVNLEQDQAIDKLRKQLDELAKKKDKTDIVEVKLVGSMEPDVFRVLCEQFRIKSQKMPQVAIKAIFHEYIGVEYISPELFGHELELEELRLARVRQLVDIKDRVVTPRNDHPLVKEVNVYLMSLKQFMDEASPEFAQSYEEKKMHQFSLENYDFWRSNLGLTITS